MKAASEYRRLSILLPVYNERDTVCELLDRVRAAALPDGLAREVVVVDDGSTDGTRELLEAYAGEHPDEVTLHLHEQNRGKGSAIATAIQQATGDILLIQDADLEYDPSEYGKLLRPILDGLADVVIGSRFLGGPHRVLYFWHYVGNRMLTTLSNVLTNLNLTDMECCYKVFRADVLRRLSLRSERFGIEPELVARVAQLGCRIYEVPVSYHGRDYAHGKKITWKDGLAAVWHILRFTLFSRRPAPLDHEGERG